MNKSEIDNYDERQDMMSFYSDYYKDVHGIRPRWEYEYFLTGDFDEVVKYYNEAMDQLQVAMDAEHERDVDEVVRKYEVSREDADWFVRRYTLYLAESVIQSIDDGEWHCGYPQEALDIVRKWQHDIEVKYQMGYSTHFLIPNSLGSYLKEVI